MIRAYAVTAVAIARRGNHLLGGRGKGSSRFAKGSSRFAAALSMIRRGVRPSQIGAPTNVGTMTSADHQGPSAPIRGPVRKAMIPAAGLGTRFLPATKATPKEM